MRRLRRREPRRDHLDQGALHVLERPGMSARSRVLTQSSACLSICFMAPSFLDGTVQQNLSVNWTT